MVDARDPGGGAAARYINKINVTMHVLKFILLIDD